MTKGRVLVTGAAGFLGSRVVGQLLVAGYEVIGLKKKNTSLIRLGKMVKHPKLIWHDFENGLADCFAEPVQHIIHLATSYGRNNETFTDVATANIVLPLSLLELGIEHGVKLFVNADTFFHVKLGLSPKEKSYITTKKLFLTLAKDVAKDKIKFANLRIEQMYGPEDNDKKFITTILSELTSNQSELLLTKGGQQRDFIYVDDAAGAFVAAVKNESALPGYQEFGIGTGKVTKIKNIVIYLKKITHSKVRLKWGALPMRQHEIMSSSADLKNNHLLQWWATTGWKEGLQRAVQSFLKK